MLMLIFAKTPVTNNETTAFDGSFDGSLSYPPGTLYTFWVSKQSLMNHKSLPEPEFDTYKFITISNHRKGSGQK